MIGRTAKLVVASLVCLSAHAGERADQENARKLLMSAYSESATFCEMYPQATYVTQIAGIRIDVDCKERNYFVANLSSSERQRLNLE